MAQPAVRPPVMQRSRIARPGGIPASRSGDRIHLTEAVSSSLMAKNKTQKAGVAVAVAGAGKVRADGKVGPQRPALTDVSNRATALGRSQVEHASLKPGVIGHSLRSQNTKSMTRLRDPRSRSSVEPEKTSVPKRSISDNANLAGQAGIPSASSSATIVSAQSMEVEAPTLLPPHPIESRSKWSAAGKAASRDEDATVQQGHGLDDEDLDDLDAGSDDAMSDVDSTTSGSDDATGEEADGEPGHWLESERLGAGPRPESVTSAEDGDALDYNIDPEGLVSLHPELEEAARRKVALIKARFQDTVIRPRAQRAQAQRAEAVSAGQLSADVAAHEDELIIMGLDPDEVRDTSMVAEYSNEIFNYMSRCERETMANPNYMDFQSEIHWHMRATLVDWLLQVHMRYHMLPETLWIAINVVDRFLSVRVVSLAKLQLVGVTAMFIAAKYEEIVAPSVTEFVYMTEGGYSKEEILKGERIILSTLDFNISSYCSPYSWVRRISKADDYDIRTRTLSKFLMELALLDHRFLRARPSLVAAVGMFLAKKMLGGEWDDGFVYYSDFTEEQLVPGANLLLERLLDPGFEEQFVYRKYANKKFLKASVFARDWAYQNHSALMAAAAAAAAASSG
ncbi:B-type cyclin 2 [Testicularia cyperi]|uniref:B-type cyclin 2 n=1 Tax=Testicularia cyperi TaxID=1882483 RepID=A0A317XYK7_9BASI|nr:B-type cyclin 2 [Testicularia cyperi]